MGLSKRTSITQSASWLYELRDSYLGLKNVKLFQMSFFFFFFHRIAVWDDFMHPTQYLMRSQISLWQKI